MIIHSINNINNIIKIMDIETLGSHEFENKSQVNTMLKKLIPKQSPLIIKKLYYRPCTVMNVVFSVWDHKK